MSVTFLFMFIVPIALTLSCCFATLACVSKLVAVKALQWIWDQQVSFYFQVSNFDFLWHVRSVEPEKQGVGRNKLPLFLHRYTVNFKDTQSL